MSLKRTGLRGLFTQRGGYLGRPSDSAELRAFLSSIRPQRTGYGLIRIGGDGDGGYLVPDDLEGLSACFSPGVADSAEFEMDLANRWGIPSWLADHSVEAPPVAHEMLHFTRKFLGSRNDATTMRLADWMAGAGQLSAPGDLILQMDIEHGEYDVLIDTPADVLARFRILVIEFHSFEVVFDRFGLRTMRAVFDKLLSRFCVAHIHPNNGGAPYSRGDIVVPSLPEISFLRLDRVRDGGPVPVLPHPLDRRNTDRWPDLPLPAGWRD
jgi:hypothetical protein